MRFKRHAKAIVITLVLAVLGTLLALNLAGGEKRIEVRPQHQYAAGDPQFLRSMGVLLGPPLTAGNRVTTLVNGDRIFPSMLQAIGDAKSTITFETYIYWSGEVGRQFAQALADRARAGVKVHVLVDWVGSQKMDQSLVELMESAGVELRKYRPLRWYNLGRLNNRTHRKLLVVDGRVGFTGGVGIADEWTGDAQGPDHWRDTHFRLEGPAALQMQATFMDNWTRVTGRVLHGDAYFPPAETADGAPAAAVAASATMVDAGSAVRAAPPAAKTPPAAKPATAGGAVAAAKRDTPAGTQYAQVFASSSEGGAESMHLMYLLAIAAATQTIDLAMAYFVPDEVITETLVAAMKRGVRLRVILPNHLIDAGAVRSASRSKWGPLLEAGAEIHEYQPTMYHVKSMVVDTIFVSVGSTNFDPRSFRLNDEANLNVYDADFAREQVRVFEADLAKSRRITLQAWRARPWTEKLWEHTMGLASSQL